MSWKYKGLEDLKRMIIFKNSKSMNVCKSLKLEEDLINQLIKRDYGDEKDIEEEYSWGMDIEIDGDYICDYSNCRTAEDFERVARNSYKKHNKVGTITNDKEDKKRRVCKKFKWLEKNKGLKFPHINELAMYLRNEAYQDKVKIYQELIDVLQDEIDEYFNSVPDDDDDDYQLPF